MTTISSTPRTTWKPDAAGRRTPRILKAHASPWRAEWTEGGPYIDVYHDTKPYPIDVINVWDYDAGVPSIPPVRSAVRVALFVWIKDNAEDYANNL